MSETKQKTNNNPLVSVIIPLYNAEKYLAETIQNVLNQTYHPIEIIVIDDGSTDKSLSIAKSFEGEKVKVFSQNNSGASAARNYGLREAKGEFIQFLDADDLLSTNKIEEQVKLLLNSPDKLAVCPTIHFFDGEDFKSKQPIHEWYKEDSDDPVDFLINLYGGDLIGPTYGGMITVHAWLTPKDIIQKAGFWNEGLTVDDDGEFFCRVLLASSGTRYTESGINYYRKYLNKKSLSAQKSEQAVLSAFSSLQLKRNQLLSRTSDSRARVSLARCFGEFSFSNYNFSIQISKEAEKMGIELDANIDYNLFYKAKLKRGLSKMLGWRFVKKLETFKTKFK